MGYIRPEVNKLTKNQRDTIIRKGKSFDMFVQTWRINDDELKGEYVFKHGTNKIPNYINFYDRSLQSINFYMKFLPFSYRIEMNISMENDEERKNINEKLDHVIKFLEWAKSYDKKIALKKIKDQENNHE